MISVVQTPEAGARFLRFVGETIQVRLKIGDPPGGKAFLRTNLGNAYVRRREIIAAVENHRPRLDTDWHDLPMRRIADDEFLFEATLDEIGVFEAKAFFQSENGEELHWAEGENLTFKVEPASLAAANTVYTAFIRQFGRNQDAGAISQEEEIIAEDLEAKGCTVIPRSGKFRDFIRELDFIITHMGFRIIQLLPVHPIPTTYARMGRFGSPFAALDFKNVDRGLAEFDNRTTPMEQFMEVVQEIHARDGRVLMDIALNHTGWASELQTHHPEWFPRNPDGSFKSPGAWGVVWEDLTELDYSHKSLWKYVAEVFLYWCGKGVDGFRCDAGYMLPFAVWEYIVAKVREIYPETVFLLEGLGGKVSTTKNLLGKAGLNWAYSELFQNYSRDQIEEFLPVSLDIEGTSGLLVAYAETHDNNRLAATSTVFARMRTAVCALCSQCGAFGITNGVEWLAEKKVDVHGAPSLNWGAEDNLVDWLRRLNAIVSHHPAFQTNSSRKMIQTNGGNSLALLRKNSGSDAAVMVLANLSHTSTEPVHWDMPPELEGKQLFDLLTGEEFDIDVSPEPRCQLQPGEMRCLAPSFWQVEDFMDFTDFGPALDRWRFRSKYIEIRKSLMDDGAPLGPVSEKEVDAFMESWLDTLHSLANSEAPNYVQFSFPADLRREVIVPPGMFLVVEAASGFLLIERSNGIARYADKSLALDQDRHIAIVPPHAPIDQAEHREIELHMFKAVDEGPSIKRGKILRLSPNAPSVASKWPAEALVERDMVTLLTNTRSSVAYTRAAWGQIRSQYDCILAVNPDCAFPADRRVLWTRCRCWVVCKDYSRELNLENMVDFAATPGCSAIWKFLIPIGRGYAMPFRIELTLDSESDAATLSFRRDAKADSDEYPILDSNEPVTLIVRPDCEDRNFHTKTKAFLGPEEIYPNSVVTSDDGFVFQPGDMPLELKADGSQFVSEPEWLYMVEHPIDGERGLGGSSDLFSPGYFQIDLKADETMKLIGKVPRQNANQSNAIPNDVSEPDRSKDSSPNSILDAAKRACKDFIVNRNSGSTVIAGYPWFLDWGRDTLIALRGIISIGWHDLALDILKEFARFESNGTIPNMIHGDDASNRDTSDAPLWLFLACRDLMASAGDSDVLGTDCGGRTIGDVLVSIAENYCQGTPNGIAVDNSSGLVYSPEHFTWMDTQYPAGTPRAGYPIEIQALWSAALDFLAKHDSDHERWTELRDQVNRSITDLFVLPDAKGLADCLHASKPLQRAADCIADDHCRPNQLFAVTLGDILSREQEIQVVQSCWKLIVPGAIRTLADCPVEFELPVRDADGELLNDPKRPYWGIYTGDEDTSRKPAYHNGTAWTWPFPSFCEALVKVYGQDAAVTARALLGSCAELFNSGCAGHLPEILDGAAPHRQRGCSAQAWGATEVARVAGILETR